VKRHQLVVKERDLKGMGKKSGTRNNGTYYKKE
jgi:hypothetical protein